MATFHPLRVILRAPTSHARASVFTACHQTVYTRTYHNTPSLRLPYKDDQDRQSLKPKEVEGGASATAEGIADTDAAFDASKTKPEDSHAAADQQTGSKGGDSNPLDSSGTNPEASKSPEGDGGPEMKETVKGGNRPTSAHGSPQKKGKLPGGA